MLASCPWTLMLARDNINDLFDHNYKEMKHEVGRRFDNLYNHITEDFVAEEKYCKDNDCVSSLLAQSTNLSSSYMMLKWFVSNLVVLGRMHGWN